MKTDVFRRVILPWLAHGLFRLLSSTWRITYLEDPEFVAALANGERIVFAHWHGSELCILKLVTRYRIATMTSTSADGSLIDFVIKRLGGATSRGSSTRGSVGALKGLVRLVGQGYRASMAVDGPKGPLGVVKPGVFEVSRVAKARIVSTGAATSRAITFEKSWNKAQLPKPFARVVVRFGAPWPIYPREASARDPEVALRLASEITRACQVAEEHLRS